VVSCACEVKEEEVVLEEPLPAPETIVIRVNGMMCGHCTAAVEKACLSVPGTVTAVASLEEKSVTVTGSADYEALKQAIIAEEYEVVDAPKAETLVIRVNGMMCGHCTASVEKACLGVPGTLSAVASLEDKNVTVTGTASYDELKKAILAEDYEVVEDGI
jgi:copper chaperone CopZ